MVTKGEGPGGLVVSGRSRTPSAIAWQTTEGTESAEGFPVVF